jgi:hypothetical protein
VAYKKWRMLFKRAVWDVGYRKLEILVLLGCSIARRDVDASSPAKLESITLVEDHCDLI